MNRPLTPIEAFWKRVVDRRRQLETDALAGKLGPAAVVSAGKVEAIWIASLDKPDAMEYEDVSGNTVKDWRPGVSCLASLRIAAQRIVEGSHRLATKEEIDANLAEQKRQKEVHDAQDRGLSQRHTIKTIQLPKEV